MIWLFSDFQDGGRRHVGIAKFQIFDGRYGQEVRNASSCQMASKSVEQPRLRYGDFSIFQDGGRRHLGFLKFQIFNGRGGQEGRTTSACQISSKSRKLRLRYNNFRLFQDGGRPPSWICNACVVTTHEEYLVVFITVQNLVGIDAAVLIICTFFDFASLAWKRLFTPRNWGFLGGKWRKGWDDIVPQRTRSYFWGFTRLCPIW